MAALAEPGVMLGQEAVRQSLAGEQAAEARRKAQTEVTDYNMKLGPTTWSFTSGLSVEVSDNVRYESNAQSDVVIRPDVGTRMIWPVSERNSINLAFGVGYAFYAQHSEYNYYFVRPGSELSFDIYAGDVWINLHDRFAITQDSYQDPTVVGASDQPRLENSLGLAAVWDLNKIILKSGYDHVTYMSLGGNNSQYYQAPDGQSEVLSFSGGYLFRPELQMGLELGTSMISYDPDTTSSISYNDAVQWNVGVYADARLTEYMKLRASGGYMVFSPDFLPGAQDTGDFDGFYAQLNFSHRLSRYLEYGLDAGRQVSFAFYGGTVDLYFLRWSANWQLFEKTSLSTGLNFEHGEQLYAYVEKFDRFGPNIAISRRLTEKLTASLIYQYYWRGSDVPNRDYTMNSLMLSARYQF